MRHQHCILVFFVVELFPCESFDNGHRLYLFFEIVKRCWTCEQIGNKITQRLQQLDCMRSRVQCRFSGAIEIVELNPSVNVILPLSDRNIACVNRRLHAQINVVFHA